jgi:hypothetical protein
MSVPSQTYSRSNLREFAFTRDNWLRREVNTVFTRSPAAMIFLGKGLTDFGGNNMMGSGKVVVEGGQSIVQPVTLGEHSGGGTIPGPWGLHNVDPDDNTRLAEASWRFYQHSVVVNDHEIAINRGDFARGSFIENQTKNVMRTLIKQEVTDLFATTSAAEGLTSLADLVNANQSSIQGFNTQAGNYTTYNSRGLSPRGTAPASIVFNSGSFAAQGLEDMRTAYNNACEGPGAEPNVILTDYETHERYESRLQPLERFQGAVPTADGSFIALAFRKTQVWADGYCTSGVMYFLNTSADGVQCIVLRGFDNDFDEFKPSTTQRAAVSPLGFTANMFIKDRRFCNKMTNISD